MSLSVKAVDRFNGPITLQVEDIRKVLLIDDTLETIKAKLFLFGVPQREVDYLYNPNLIKIESNNQLITKTHSLSNCYESLPKSPVIQVTHLIDQLKGEPFNIEEREAILNALREEYVDLTMDDLEYVYNYIAEQPVDEHLENEEVLVEKLSEKYQDDFYVDNFYKLAEKPLKDLPEIIYTNIDFQIKSHESQSRIRIEKLFNTFELTDTIPLVALSRKYASEYTKGPLIKVSNTLLEKVPEREIKSWLLNEKTKINQASFKIVKGLMMKINLGPNYEYLTLNIMPDGYMTINFKMDSEVYERESMTLEIIIALVKKTINDVLVSLNKLDNRKIFEVTDLEIASMDTVMYTNFEISRSKFSKLLLIPSVSNILELKNIQSQDLISMYYKKISRTDTKGLTINIKDNPFEKNSSIIVIFGAENLIQMHIIYATIRALNELSEFSTQNKKGELILRERKLKEITTKSLLKKEGFTFDSTKCQKPSQPIIVKDNIMDEHTIKFDKWTFRCTNEKKPYPGFHSDNIPCCYKKPQVGKETFIRNVDPESLEILVKPSNLKVKIGKFEAFVVKKISEGTSDTSHYFYLSEENKLMPITDSKTIKLINKTQEQGNIWLETVTLSEMIYPASSHKCQKRPELNREFMKKGISTFVNHTDINHSCDIYKNAPFFGYASSSIPCCYNTERDIYITKNKREENKLNKYIATTSNKLLNFKKMGVLPKDLNYLFNKIKSEDAGEGEGTEGEGTKGELEDAEGELEEEAAVKVGIYYRMGIVQNKSSFLNAVLLGIDNHLNGNEIYGITDFKTIIINYITPDLFVKLNHGKVALKYHSIENYIRYISENTLLWEDLIDLLEMITRHNILILDTTSASQIVCRINEINKEHPFLILLKKSNSYELIVKLNKDAEGELFVMKAFDHNVPVVQFLLDYQNDTCIRENVYPENYPYKKMMTIDQIASETVEVTSPIKFQIANSFNLVNMVMIDSQILIPVVETGIIDGVPTKTINDIDLADLKTYKKAYNSMDIGILGITKSNRDAVGGILTDFGFLVPYKISKDDTNIFPLLNFVYYIDVDTKLRSDTAGPVLVDRSLMNDIFKTKTKIVKAFEQIKNGDKVKEYLLDLIKETDIPRYTKIQDIVNVFKQFGKSKPDHYTLFILNIIANEMLLDNKENALLNGIITNPEDKGQNIIKRDTESILLNLDDIYKWIRLYK